MDKVLSVGKESAIVIGVGWWVEACADGSMSLFLQSRTPNGFGVWIGQHHITFGICHFNGSAIMMTMDGCNQDIKMLCIWDNMISKNIFDCTLTVLICFSGFADGIAN
eukprot:4066820-Ditylum_brightwellii.AAC.1